MPPGRERFGYQQGLQGAPADFGRRGTERVALKGRELVEASLDVGHVDLDLADGGDHRIGWRVRRRWPGEGGNQDGRE